MNQNNLKIFVNLSDVETLHVGMNQCRNEVQRIILEEGGEVTMIKCQKSKVTVQKIFMR